jgi:hypothetical protein
MWIERAALAAAGVTRELEICPDARLRDRVRELATRKAGQILALGGAPTGAAAFFLGDWLSRRAVPYLPGSVSPTLVAVIASLLLVLIIQLMFVVFVRREVRLSARGLLRKNGVPVCLGCGYFCGDAVRAVCPECGRRMNT